MTKEEIFNDMDSFVKSYIKHFQDDFYKHDKPAIAEKEDPCPPFLWAIRQSGTNLLFLDFDPEHTINRTYSRAQWFIGSNERFFFFSRNHILNEISLYEALEIIERNIGWSWKDTASAQYIATQIKQYENMLREKGVSHAVGA